MAGGHDGAVRQAGRAGPAGEGVVEQEPTRHVLALLAQALREAYRAPWGEDEAETKALFARIRRTLEGDASTRRGPGGPRHGEGVASRA